MSLFKKQEAIDYIKEKSITNPDLVEKMRQKTSDPQRLATKLFYRLRDIEDAEARKAKVDTERSVYDKWASLPAVERWSNPAYKFAKIDALADALTHSFKIKGSHISPIFDPMSKSVYMMHNKSGKIIRISDHAPVTQSSNRNDCSVIIERDILIDGNIYDGSFDGLIALILQKFSRKNNNDNDAKFADIYVYDTYNGKLINSYWADYRCALKMDLSQRSPVSNSGHRYYYKVVANYLDGDTVTAYFDDLEHFIEELPINNNPIDSIVDLAGDYWEDSSFATHIYLRNTQER